MAILLGYTSALEYWRSCATVHDAHLHSVLLGGPDERKSATASARSKLLDLQARRDSIAYAARYPGEHVLVCKRAKSRYSVDGIHALSSLPARSCVCSDRRIDGEKVFVSTPEFCFVQMAQVLSLEKLIALGFEMCGTYARTESGTSYGAYPLTSPDKLQAFVEKTKDIKGLRNARRAARYVIANSASPMETVLAMYLTLPYAMGGYGFEKPEMNRMIPISTDLKSKIDSRYYVSDLYWANSKLGIEYDSDFAHAGINKTIRDALRRSVMTGMGLYVLSVTKPQIKDARAVNQIAHIVSKRTGKRLRYNESEFESKHRRLRSQILSA